MYEFYLDRILLPVTPSNLQLSIRNQNQAVALINENEVNVLRKAGLTDIEFEALLPNVSYPFAVYKGGFQPGNFFLEEIKYLKAKQKPFQLLVSRISPNGDLMFETNMKVSLEEYQVKEDAKEGTDLLVSIKLKQYLEYGTKICEVVAGDQGTQLSVIENREDANAPKAKTYTVVKGDTLWGIAKKFYGNGSQYPVIYEANRDKVKNPNKIQIGWTLTIPNR